MGLVVRAYRVGAAWAGEWGGDREIRGECLGAGRIGADVNCRETTKPAIRGVRVAGSALGQPFSDAGGVKRSPYFAASSSARDTKPATPRCSEPSAAVPS